MPRTCSTCSHPDRTTIDSSLVAGEAFRNIAERFGLSATGVFRHKADHVPTALARAQEAVDVVQAGDLLGQVQSLQARTMTILSTAEKAGDLRTALMAIREARTTLELLLEVEGELDRRPQIAVMVTPEWVRVRTALLQALMPFPDARAAVAGRLTAMEVA